MRTNWSGQNQADLAGNAKSFAGVRLMGEPPTHRSLQMARCPIGVSCADPRRGRGGEKML